jgi:hypothetical protein
MSIPMRPRKAEDNKKTRSLGPAFRNGGIREKDSRTAETGDPSIS